MAERTNNEDSTRPKSTAIHDQLRQLHPAMPVFEKLTRSYSLFLIRQAMGELNAIRDVDARLNAFSLALYMSAKAHTAEALFMILWAVLIPAGFACLVVLQTGFTFLGFMVGFTAGAAFGFCVVWGGVAVLRGRRHVQACLDDLGYIKCQICGAQYNDEIPCDCGHVRNPSDVPEPTVMKAYIAKLKASFEKSIK